MVDGAARFDENAAKAGLFSWFSSSRLQSRSSGWSRIFDSSPPMARKTNLDVAYVAKLARLNLTAEETDLFQSQLGHVLEYADKLREVNVSHVEAAAHAIPIFNVFREDEPRDWFTAEQALSNAPRQANGLFIVTKVVE